MTVRYSPRERCARLPMRSISATTRSIDCCGALGSITMITKRYSWVGQGLRPGRHWGAVRFITEKSNEFSVLAALKQVRDDSGEIPKKSGGALWPRRSACCCALCLYEIFCTPKLTPVTLCPGATVTV